MTQPQRPEAESTIRIVISKRVGFALSWQTLARRKHIPQLLASILDNEPHHGPRPGQRLEACVHGGLLRAQRLRPREKTPGRKSNTDVQIRLFDTYVVVLTSTRIMKSVVTGQAPGTLELRNTLGKNTNKPKMVRAYITADAIHASTTKHIEVKTGVSLRCARSILVHTSHYSRLGKPIISLATQERLPRICYT